MDKVCLILVTYNRYAILIETLARISQQLRMPDHILIVDNCSTDGTVEKLTLNKGNWDLIQMDANQGYGAAATAGMRHALDHYKDLAFFWIMDDDSRPSPDSLRMLVESFALTSKTIQVGVIGLVGFKLKFGGYTAVNALQAAPESVILAKPQVVETDFVLMDGSLIAMEVVRKCGYYVEDYFMIGEDYEYCKRVKHGGFKVALLLDESAAMDRLILGGGGGFTRSNIWRGYYQARNQFFILRAYFSWVDALSYFTRQFKFLAYALLARDRFERIYYRLLGIVHGFRRISGRTIEPFS